MEFNVFFRLCELVRNPADYVIFGGKTQVAGVFFNPEIVNTKENDIIGLSQGSPVNITMFSVFSIFAIIL